MVAINLAILNSKIGNFYLPIKVRDYCQLDSSVRVQGSVSVTVDVAKHVKSTTPSTLVWFKKTSLTVWGCWVLTHSLEGFFSRLFVSLVLMTTVSVVYYQQKDTFNSL